MEVQAQARWVRTAPRKVRLVAQSLRGLPVGEALTACQFMPRSAARDVAKVIRSAQANAEHNFNLARDDLFIKDLRVEAGPMLKRGQPRAMGRLFSVFKRTSHITAVVEDRPGELRQRRPAAPARRAATPRPARPEAAAGAGSEPPAAEANAQVLPAAEPASEAEVETEAPRKATRETRPARPRAGQQSSRTKQAPGKGKEKKGS
jgi:large subunit ribosomal protein L22